MNSTFLNQITSSLLRLPAEIRNQIYGDVFYTTRIKICRKDHPLSGHGTIVSDPHAHYPRQHLHLLEACRQTYTEARLVAYEVNEVVGDRSAIELFLGPWS